MRGAVREIFDTDPIQFSSGGPIPGTKSLELALLILTIPPGIFYAKRLVHDFQLAERWRRLVARAERR